MNRRALTLVEVLAATVLLALLAGTCVPFLQRATRALRPGSGAAAGVDVQDLAALADAVVAQPAEFGIDDFAGLDETTFDWPQMPEDRPAALAGPVTLRRLEAGPLESLETEDERRAHAWLVFTCEGTSVYRWLALEAPGQEAGGDEENGADKEEEPDS